MISAIWVNCMKFYKRVFVKMAEWLPDDVYLKLVYYAKFHRRLNLKCPVTYTEKLNWLKLHDRKMKYHEIVDKYEAKNYVAQILGDRYIIPTYGVWERFEDIDFSTLPQKFAIKTTHDSCHYALVHNKNEMNINDIRKTIEDGLKKNHYYMCREWPYKDLRPRIIAEELISDNPPDDYKFFMFHGKMDSVMVCTERATGHPKFRFYDQDWNRLYYQKTDREPATDVKMPANFLEMIKVAETLSTGFVHVRVDLYNVNEHVYFGELTLYDNGGFDLDITYETELLWGRKMDLSCVSDNYASNKDKGVE